MTKKPTNINNSGKVIIPANASPWPHELRVAKILALAGHISKIGLSTDAANSPKSYECYSSTNAVKLLTLNH